MTHSTVTIERWPDAVRAIVPAGTPAVAPAGPGVMVLEVLGGLLTWNVLAAQELPVAIIDDVDAAQEWVWALYGELVATALDAVRPRARELDRDLAEFDTAATGPDTPLDEPTGVDDGVYGADAVDRGPQTLPADSRQRRLTEAATAPGLPALVASARRLAYAHWASRWWPVSVLDGIAALDQALLDRDIALLTEECESLVDGDDAVPPPVREPVESSLRASDYALAAGDGDRIGAAMVLARGTGGWDWRRCPPGLVDASESAVSWQVLRAAGVTTVAIAVAAHPDLPAGVPEHLRPWARVDTGRGELLTELRPGGDSWTGESDLPASASTVDVAIGVPGFGPDLEADPQAAAQGAVRRRIRDFAAERLRTASAQVGDDGPFAPLLAEIDAAAGDSDF
ncbi:hypothetical protein ACFRAQ_06430 [Nocardia sp. NPDC056611]|uniref:hypothetical protein n=1 Tax=Nocardia sp. NPDC056611 TaxID=3345877 RepID=UPI00366C0DE3